MSILENGSFSQKNIFGMVLAEVGLRVRAAALFGSIFSIVGIVKVNLHGLSCLGELREMINKFWIVLGIF